MDNIKAQLVTDARYREALEGVKQNPNVLIALTNNCNFKCQYCSTRNEKKENKHISLNLLKKIIDDCRAEGWRYSFGQTYEPFLHPQVKEIISYVNDTGAIFTSATNGSLLGEIFYNLSLNLLISMSATKEDYAFRGGKTKFESYKKTISDFVKYRVNNKIRGKLTFQIADYSFLNSQYAGYDKEIVEVEQIYSKINILAEMFGLDLVHDYDECCALIKKRIPVSLYSDEIIQVNIVSTKIMPNTFETLFGEDITPAQSGYCDSCYSMMSIQADGGIAFCCCDPTAKVIADYYDGTETLRSIWFGEKMENIREAFSCFNPIHKFCRKCLFNVSEHIKPILTVHKPQIVQEILEEKGINENLPWFTFPKCG